MPTRPCPDCQHVAPRWLDGPSTNAVVDYYRCDHCGHVFSVPKDRPNAPSRDVTPSKRQTPPQEV